MFTIVHGAFPLLSVPSLEFESSAVSPLDLPCLEFLKHGYCHGATIKGHE